MTRTQIVGMLAAIFLFVAIYFVFSFAEIEMTMLEVQKIFYFHISSAFYLIPRLRRDLHFQHSLPNQAAGQV